MSLTIIIPTVGRDSLLHSIWSVNTQTVPTKCIIQPDNNQEGAALTRNRAIKNVKTSWVGFCDDDDWLDEHYHEWLKFKARSTNADMIIFQMQRTDGMVLPDHTDVDKLAHNWVGISFAIRTKIAIRLPFRNMIGEDYDLIQRVKQAGLKVVVSPKVAYFVGSE